MGKAADLVDVAAPMAPSSADTIYISAVNALGRLPKSSGLKNTSRG
jgi:hypothetical protein